MNNSITFDVNLKVIGGNVVGTITKHLQEMERTTQKATKSFGDCFKILTSFSLVSDGLRQLEDGFNNLIQLGVVLNTNMAELSAITGVTGKGLEDIEKAARSTAKVFGTDASANVESYKLILSQLDPEIAKNSEAMRLMGENVNILSKQMGGDTVAATNVLTTSMNQFGVSTQDPIQASKIMADMMNVMSAAAQAGSAELPQIQSALEQVGMVAKTTGLSFAETNAQIQILDKAGKKGSEGGVALRNVLTTLSEGRFTSKDAAAGLEQAGISVNYLADASIPLTTRLKSLSKIQGDTALMTKVFGKENMAASIAMIQGADNAERLSKQIVNIQSASEQAKIIMGSYGEKIKRMSAWLNDLKIGFFNAIEPMAPFVQGIFSGFTALGGLANAGVALKTAYDAVRQMQVLTTISTWYNNIATKINTTFTRENTTERFKNAISAQYSAAQTKLINIQMGIGAVLSRIHASGIKSVAMAYGQATFGAVAFGVALDALGIGLILLAVTGLVMGLKHLWENSRKFREIIGGIGGAAGAVFHNIGVVVSRLWTMIIKPIVGFIWNYHVAVYTGIWEIVKKIFAGISSVFSYTWNSIIKPIAGFIWEMYAWVFSSIWEVVKSVFTAIGNFASGIWNWIKNTFSGFAKFLYDYLISPIYSAFSGVWNWITNLFDKLMNKLSGLLAPIREFWNTLFSEEGMVSVKTAYKVGAENEGKKFDEEQKSKAKGEKPQEVKIVKNDKPLFDVSKGTPITNTIGGVAAEKTKNKKEHVGNTGGSSEGKSTVRSLNINKMIENITITNQNGTFSKEYLTQAIREALLTSVADFTAVE